MTLSFRVNLDQVDDADGAQSDFSILIQVSHVDTPEHDEYVHELDAPAGGRRVEFHTLPLEHELGGIIFYMQAARRDPESDRVLREPVAKQYLPLVMFATAAEGGGGFSVPLINLVDLDGRALRKAQLAIRDVTAAFGSGDVAPLAVYSARIAALERRCNEINDKTIAFFMGQTGYKARDKRAEHDVCVNESASYPVKYMPINAFLFSRMHAAAANSECVDVAFTHMLMNELDARAQTREWFQSTLLTPTPTPTASASAQDQLRIAIETAMAALTVVTRALIYTSDTARFSGGMRIDGDSYDVALVNGCGDCDDLGISIYILARHVKTRFAQSDKPLLRAWAQALAYYDVVVAFGGVSSAAFTDSAAGASAPAVEYGNHFWIMALRKASLSDVKAIPHAELLDGTGHVYPSIVPPATRLVDPASREQMLADHVDDTTLLKSVQAVAQEMDTRGISIGPVCPFDVTLASALEQSTAAFYRQPIGIVKPDKSGVSVFSVDDRKRTFGVPILDVMRPWHESRLSTVSIHSKVLTDADTRMFEEDARMRVFAPPFAVTHELAVYAAELQARLRASVAPQSLRTDQPVAPRTHSTVRCSFVPDVWPKFEALLVGLTRIDSVYVRVYPLRAPFYRHETRATGGGVCLVQVILGVARSDPQLKRAHASIAASWESVFFQ
jgi:hypothetical protein